MAINDKVSNPIGYVTIKASDDLLPNRFVGFDLKHPAVESKSIGVTECKWKKGEMASILAIGVGIVETSTAINIGDKLTCDTDGKAKKATGSTVYNGRSLDTITEAGFVRILLTT